MKVTKYRLKCALALLLCVTMLVPQVAMAAWESSKAVHIDPKAIENSTIIVGTHLIHLSAMTDMLYEEAVRSASESGQSTIYYKSELAGGDWFDITGAASVAEISTGGLPVPNKTIAALYFNYHTKSDGLTYDLRTNKVIHVFDIRDPSDFYSLDEMLPYKNQEEYVSQSPVYKEAEMAMYNMEWYGELIITQRKDGRYNHVTNLWNNMATMDDYQAYLRQNNATADELNIVQQAIGYQNAERWSWTLNHLDSRLVSVSNTLVTLNDAVKASSDSDEEQPIATNKTPQSTLDSIGESRALVKSSLIKWDGKRLTKGNMVADQYRYNYYNDLINSTSIKINNPSSDVIKYRWYGNEVTITEKDVVDFNASSLSYYFFGRRYTFKELLQEYQWYGTIPTYGNYGSFLNGVASFKENSSYRSGDGFLFLREDMDIERKQTMGINYEGANAALANLLNLERIENSDIVNRAAELDLLTKELTPSATNVYLQRLNAGLNFDYQVAVQDQSSQALFDSIITSNNATVGSAQTELEYFLEEMVDRLSKTDGIALLDTRLAEARGYYSPIPRDAFQAGANASVDAHIVFLSRLRSSVLGEESSEEDKLAAEKSDLQTELMDALDNNLLEDANALRTKITALDDQLAELEDTQAAEQAELTELIGDLEDKLEDATNAGDTALADQLSNLLGNARGDLSSGIGNSNGELGNLAEELKKSGLSAIASGDTVGVDSSLDGLIGLGGVQPLLGYPAISSLRDAMLKKQGADGNNAFGSQLGKAEAAMRDGADGYNGARLASDGNNRIKGMLDGYDSSQSMHNAAMAGALGQLVDGNGNDELLKLLADLMDKLFKDGNPYVYIRYDDGVNEYIPCNVLCNYTGMRYVWQQSERTGTMSKKGNYYSFTVDSAKVTREKNGSKADVMEQAAKWQDTIHVYEGYTMAQFGAEAYYIPSTQYGVLLTDEMREMLEEILGTMKGVS